MDVRTFATDCKKLAKKAEDYAVVMSADNMDVSASVRRPRPWYSPRTMTGVSWGETG